MAHRLYCIEHARREQLVVASHVCDGRSVCTDHTMGTNLPLIPIASGHQVPTCDQCRAGTSHRAYFKVDHRTLCVRHAADAVFESDDMGAHDMAHAAYLSLKAVGVENAY